jgi:hypothetical protein
MRSFASVFTAERCHGAATHVHPISRAAVRRSMFASRVLPTTRPLARSV